MKKQKKMIIGGVTVGIVVCLTLGAGIYIQKHHNKSTFGAENQTVSDEVAEIESINAKDNVVDVENLFEGEKVSWKEKQEIKKDASKNLSSNKSSKLDEKVSESDKKLAESDKLSEADKKPSEPNKKPSKPDEKPSKPDERPSKPDEKPSEPDERPSKPDEKPSEPDERPSEPDEQPSKPALPQVNEPGWITGIY